MLKKENPESTRACEKENKKLERKLMSSLWTNYYHFIEHFVIEESRDVHFLGLIVFATFFAHVANIWQPPEGKADEESDMAMKW